MQQTGRKRLIIAGLHTEICLTFGNGPGAKDGHDAMYVTDAVGGSNRVPAPHGDRAARRTRARSATTALSVVTELFRDWATPMAGPALEVIHWYFREVPQLTAEVGAAEAERLPRNSKKRGREQAPAITEKERHGQRRPQQLGIIGAGRIGQAMARTALRAGRPVVIANSRGPESLTSVVSTLGDGCRPGRSSRQRPRHRRPRRALVPRPGGVQDSIGAGRS